MTGNVVGTCLRIHCCEVGIHDGRLLALAVVVRAKIAAVAANVGRLLCFAMVDWKPGLDRNTGIVALRASNRAALRKPHGATKSVDAFFCGPRDGVKHHPVSISTAPEDNKEESRSEHGAADHSATQAVTGRVLYKTHLF
jgi:hypothetical protein